jgi:hypothetical protein
MTARQHAAQVADVSARLQAAQAVAGSVQQAAASVTAALAEVREQHTAELARMAAANESLVAAAAREAAAAEARATCQQQLQLEADLLRAQQRADTLQEELQVLLPCASVVACMRVCLQQALRDSAARQCAQTALRAEAQCAADTQA